MTATVTRLPTADARLPFHAPVIGAMPLPRVPASPEISGELASLSPSGGDPTEPVAEVLLGEFLAGLSGAATGGVAAGSWYGAGIGGAATIAGWGLFSLVGSWHAVGPKTKAVLGTTTLVTGALAAAMVLRRKR